MQKQGNIAMYYPSILVRVLHTFLSKVNSSSCNLLSTSMKGTLDIRSVSTRKCCISNVAPTGILLFLRCQGMGLRLIFGLGVEVRNMSLYKLIYSCKLDIRLDWDRLEALQKVLSLVLAAGDIASSLEHHQEGMTQISILPRTSYSSQTRVGGQTPDQQKVPGFQSPTSQLAATVGPRLGIIPFSSVAPSLVAYPTMSIEE
ncbi:hypothetical protein HAX54_051370 [Datura stramonium]|uniref:Uncharacterized protein n=1 Tax=Datura stramonium TaxID=4076 RepID=A0ABS8SXK7_DATST|nr:hypothetical protein [Datura stramonium]